MHVDVFAFDIQPVGATHLDDHVCVAETTTQPRYQRLQGVRRIERWLLTPQRIDQGGLRDGPRGVDREPDQQSAQPGTSKVDGTLGTGFTGTDVEGPEQIDPHPFTIAARWTALLRRGASRAARPAR